VKKRIIAERREKKSNSSGGKKNLDKTLEGENAGGSRRVGRRLNGQKEEKTLRPPRGDKDGSVYRKSPNEGQGHLPYPENENKGKGKYGNLKKEVILGDRRLKTEREERKVFSFQQEGAARKRTIEAKEKPKRKTKGRGKALGLGTLWNRTLGRHKSGNAQPLVVKSEVLLKKTTKKGVRPQRQRGGEKVLGEAVRN